MSSSTTTKQALPSKKGVSFGVRNDTTTILSQNDNVTDDKFEDNIDVPPKSSSKNINANEQKSFRVRAARRASKALSLASQGVSNAFQSTREFANRVDSGLSETLSENRFSIRQSSRSLLQKKKEKSTELLSFVYTIRQKLQKLEFLIIWIFALILTVTVIVNQDVFETVYDITLVYVKVSVFTRLWAYIMDVTNAAVKLGTDDQRWSAIPLWLILHHGGVLGSHTVIGFFFMTGSSNYVKMLFGLIATQSSHNTWTKKYSLFLYWGNVALGFSALSYVVYLSIRNASEMIAGVIILLTSVVATLCGIILLAKQPKKPKKSSVSSVDVEKGSSIPTFPVTSLNDKITEEEEMEINKVSAKISS